MTPMRGARIAVNTCLRVKSGERVLIITDTQRLGVGMALFRASEEAKAKVMMVVTQLMKRHGQEPPEVVGRLMKKADVVFAPTTYSLTHTQARLKATLAGTRIATMPMITEEMMRKGAMLADYREVEKLTLKVARRLNRGEEVRVTSERGTDLRFSIKGRRAHPDTGRFHEPGDFGNLPAGEAFVAPVEGTGEGTVVIDGPIPDIEERNVAIKFKRGVACKIRGSRKLANMLKRAGKNSTNLAEFGIGTNPRARLIGNVLEDEKVLGTCHVALGDNSTFGGKVEADIHIDGIIKKPTVELDGKLLMKNGKLLS